MRNFSQELLKAKKQGARIVRSVPDDGWEVAHEPRHPRDPQPWVLVRQPDFRYSGRECHAVTTTGFEDALKALTEHFKDFIGDTECKPKLVHGWETPFGYELSHAIVWEEGPDDWTLYVTHQEEPIEVYLKGWPANVFAEPYNGWVMSLVDET